MTSEEYRNEVLAVKDRLHSFSVWILRDADEACDVTQEAFMRLWKHRKRVNTECAKTWLLRTAHRLCLDRLRARSRRSLLHLDEAQIADNAQRCFESDLRPGIGKALRNLSSCERAVIVLREIEGLSYEQIATVLERSLGSVKVSLHRARRRLRDELAPMMRSA